MRALSIASTGMLAQQMNVEVISNNLANMNTSGYKRQRAEFQDLLYQNIERVGAQSSDQGTIVPSGIQIGAGVKTGGVYRIIEQGTLQSTGNPYDLAINGSGYFRVQMPSGEDGYTRDGTFQLSPTGQLVTLDGYVVQPGVTIPTDAVDVTINGQGQVFVKLAGQTAPTQAGQLDLVTFPNSAGLEGVGQNILLETPASGAANVGTPGATGFGTITQGFVENSNVNPVSEITSLISAQRAYEMNSKVITAADEMLSTMNQVK